MTEPKIPTLSYLLLDPKRPYIHRDLSWIQFNERVLAEARSRSNPLLERFKFLSITASNLDEFFMIRFASLVRSLAAAKAEDSRENLQRVHGTVLESVRKFTLRQARAFDALRTEAREHGLHIHLKSAPGSDAYARGHAIFEKQILPHLELKNKFAYSSVAELNNLQMLVYVNPEMFFEVSRSLPLVFWESWANEREVDVFFLDDLILSHLEHMLSLKEKPGILRLTRDADFTIDLPGDTSSVPDIVRKNLGSRDKGRLVRLQHYGRLPPHFLEEAADQLKIDLRQCLRAPGTLCLHGLFGLVGNLPAAFSQKSGLAHPALRATVPESFRRPDLFETLDSVDQVLHHPYDSFEAFLIWLKKACDDPEVEMIEQTIYRTDAVSQLVDLLKEAAPRKKVRVFLELRARFDESNNLKTAEMLRDAGAEVRFGFGSLKLHAKVTLVTKRKGERVVRYTHLSTGNYSAKAAASYTDISVFSGNQELGEDARHFFDSIAKNEVPSSFKHLVTAPTKLHQKIRSLIKAETEAAKAKKPARIVAKVNALVDEKIIEDLYNASQAGVKVDLIVRGACSLIPGVKGLSDNIRVYSIVDRFLEHSRIYYFQNSEVIYLSSADWMPRNFFSRLEIAFPVVDKRIYRFITEIILPGYFKDNVRARVLKPRGNWRKPHRTEELHRAQWYFEELAANHYVNTPLAESPYFERFTKS